MATLERSVEYQALKMYENELIECLADVNLVSLAREAAECGLVPNKVQKNLKSLHSEVPRPLMCRYLLFNVYNGLHKKREGAYQCWLKVLLGVKKTANVLSQIEHWHDTLQGSLANQVSTGGGEGVVLTKDDITHLTEALAGCSSKWKEIATSLGLPHNEIENLVAMMHIYKPVMCLKQVLCKWVMCMFPNSRPPTLENLLTALRSQIVDLGREADQLGNTVHVFEYNRGYRCYYLKTGITRQTQNATVPEGSSTLLEVAVIDDPLTFKWHKNRKEISLKDHSTHQISDSYNGFNVSILWLNVADLTAEGTSITSFGYSGYGITLVSDPVVLAVTTRLDQHKNVLVTFYTEQPEVPEDTWPPVSSNTYISLALIKQDGIQCAGEYGRCTIRGDADDIYKNKESIMYESAFTKLYSSDRLLVEGRPGSGKTTLVHKVTQDWARGKLAFNHTRLLILVHLRTFCSDPSVALQDLLKLNYTNASTLSTISDCAEKHSGLGLCFIMDGLDEYLPKKRNTYIYST